LNLPATSCGESPIVKENVYFIFSLAPPQKAGNARFAIQTPEAIICCQERESTYFVVDIEACSLVRGRKVGGE